MPTDSPSHQPRVHQPAAIGPPATTDILQRGLASFGTLERYEGKIQTLWTVVDGSVGVGQDCTKKLMQRILSIGLEVG